MCQIADKIYETLSVLEKEPAKFLNQDFMINIFRDWRNISEFDDWWKFIYVDGRKTNTVGNASKNTRVFAMGSVLKMLFGGSNDAAIVETTDDTQTLGLKAVCRLMEEMISKKSGKNTRHFMLVADGKHLWNKMSDQEKVAS